MCLVYFGLTGPQQKPNLAPAAPRTLRRLSRRRGRFAISMALTRLVMLGPGGVGKSAITISLTQNTFVTDYDPTIENSYRKQLTLSDGSERMVEILDTAGQEEYTHMRDQYIARGDGFILVYSVGSRSSVDALADIYDRILLVKNVEKWPMVLVGNKADLPFHQREVSQGEGVDYAQKLNIPFFETSAKTHLNIDEVFRKICDEIEQHNKSMAPSATPDVEKKKKNIFSGLTSRIPDMPKGCALL